MTARVPDADRGPLERVLSRSAIKSAERDALYRKSGWKGLDETSSPYSGDAVRREREAYKNIPVS